MSYDNLCKLLSEKYPDRFANWILGQPTQSVNVLKSELSIEPIRADAVTLLQTSDRVLHLEFQVKWESNPPMPLRMLDYWVRLHRLYRLPITQVVVLLLSPKPGTIITTVFALETTRHEFQVLNLWEQPPDLLLNDPALLPLATLAATRSPTELLTRVATQIRRIESTQQQQETSQYAQILAGLKFEKGLIQQVFREGMMRDSVIYQEILQEGQQEGRQEGRQEATISLIVRQLTRRLGELNPETRSQVASLSLERLEELAEALLDFSQTSDLDNWLQHFTNRCDGRLS